MYQTLVLTLLLFAVFGCHGATASPPPWLGNQIGIDHTVPPPWTTIKCRDRQVDVWGRTITLGPGGFPIQIVNQGTPMLVAPMSLKVDFGDGEFVSLVPVTGTQQDTYPDVVTFRSQSVYSNLSITVDTDIEFDGLMKFTLSITSTPDVKVRRLVLDCPLRPDLIGPYYVSPFMGYSPTLILDTWGRIDKPRGFRFYNFFAVSGLKHALFWSAESAEGWRLQRRDRALEIIPSDDAFLFRVNLVDAYAPIELGDERTVVFGLQAGPVKPPLKDWRRYTAIWWEAEPSLLKAVKATGLTPLVCLWPFSVKGTVYQDYDPKYKRASRMAFNEPVPEDDAAFREWLADTRAAGGVVLPYINTDNFEPLWGPGAGAYRNEWAGKQLPEIIEPASRSGFHYQPVCYHSQSWQDYYVYRLAKAMETYRYGGYYCDNTSAKACKNPDHPASHQPFVDEEGKRWPRVPIFKAREFYKRIYKAVKQINPDAVFYSNGAQPPFNFFDFSLTKEYISRIAGDMQYWTDFATPDAMKGHFFRGQQIGTMRMGMAQYKGANLSKEAARAMFAILVMGDTVVHWEINSQGQAHLDWDKLKGDFKIWEATWVPYWESRNYLNCDREDVYITLYKKPTEALLIVSNPTDTPADDLALHLTASEVFPLVGTLQATDAEACTPLGMDSTMVLDSTIHSIKINVKAHDFRAIRIKTK